MAAREFQPLAGSCGSLYIRPMTRAISNLRLVLVGMFILATAASSLYQYYYIWPMQKCERAGAWWSGKYRQCVVPIPISRLTGRDTPASKPLSKP
jgi:hypothetical protein